MNAPAFFGCIDWDRPWLRELACIAEPIASASDWQDALNRAANEQPLRNHRGLPIKFVAQSELPAGMAYESYISQTGGVPTRENLHDFFNAAVWLHYPAIKARLNALQSAAIAAAQASPSSDFKRRGKLRDAATIFDENAALFITSETCLPDLLRRHLWLDLFSRRRQAFGQSCEVRLFGHALMEKLVTPYKAITAHAWVVEVEASFFSLSEQEKRSLLDCQVADQLSQGLSTTDFTPLPVLGVPDWWPGQDAFFYRDASVFRPKRIKRDNPTDR